MIRMIKDRYSAMSLSNKDGFTLIELVVVIAIMAILSMILVPNLTSYVNKARRTEATAAVTQVHNAARIVADIDDSWPFTDEKEFRFDKNGEASGFVKEVLKYVNIPDEELRNYSITPYYKSPSRSLKIYKVYGNGKYRTQITDSEGKLEIRHQVKGSLVGSSSSWKTVETIKKR